MRINEMITSGESALILFYQILPTNSLRKSMEITLEKLYVDVGTHM